MCGKNIVSLFMSSGFDPSAFVRVLTSLTSSYAEHEIKLVCTYIYIYISNTKTHKADKS